VDGTELPLTTFYYAKLYEVQKSVSLTRHMWDAWLSLANKATWDKLPDDMRGIVAKNLNQSGLDHRKDVVELEARLARELSTEKKIEVIEVKAEPFRAALQKAGFYDDWKKRFGPEMWGLLEKYTGQIA
jgi:TRAP-type C4-dicarboxylate transport system substrate-binding protein